MKQITYIIILLFQSNLIFSQISNSTGDYHTNSFFPKNDQDQFLISVSLGIGGVSSSANNIISSSFMNSNSYNSEYSGESNDLRIAKPFRSISDAHHSMPPALNANILFELLYLSRYPFHLRIFSSMDYSADFLYSTTSRKYLNDRYIPESFNETSVIYNEEILLSAGGGFLLPVYGSFSNNPLYGGKTSHSFIYLYSGISGAYPISSYADQYLQITDKKDVLRYENGTDTLRIIDREKLQTLNEFRAYLDIQVGWQKMYYNFGFGVSLYSSIQLNSVLEDQIWKQYFLGFRFSIYYNL